MAKEAKESKKAKERRHHPHHVVGGVTPRHHRRSHEAVIAAEERKLAATLHEPTKRIAKELGTPAVLAHMRPRGSKKAKTRRAFATGGVLCESDGLAYVGEGQCCRFLLGGNDSLETCLPAAFANSLLVSEGVCVYDEDILDLAEKLGGPVTIEEGLEILGAEGIAGISPRRFHPFTPETFRREREGWWLGMVAGVTYETGDHAVAVSDTGLVSWGRIHNELELDGEAWAIDWKT